MEESSGRSRQVHFSICDIQQFEVSVALLIRKLDNPAQRLDGVASRQIAFYFFKFQLFMDLVTFSPFLGKK